MPPVPETNAARSDVTAVFDLDGSMWERQATDVASDQHDMWRMRDHEPDEHESAAAGSRRQRARVFPYRILAWVHDHVE